MSLASSPAEQGAAWWGTRQLESPSLFSEFTQTCACICWVHFFFVRLQLDKRLSCENRSRSEAAGQPKKRLLHHISLCSTWYRCFPLDYRCVRWQIHIPHSARHVRAVHALQTKTARLWHAEHNFFFFSSPIFLFLSVTALLRKSGPACAE